jgi:glycosyltransferase involved in cell wall biosynthesis
MVDVLATPRRVTLVANELRGLHPAGGIGTATTFLALALARMGHETEVLVGWQPERELDPYWDGVYRQAGVRIRRAPRTGETVDPYYFAVMHNVERALRCDPPDVVVANDFGAPIHNALRLRHAGLGFEKTLFVLFCHGTRRYLLELSREATTGDLPYILAISGLEQAAVELADVVVSPSAFLVSWMRGRGWQLPRQTLVVPYLTRSAATGEPVPAADGADAAPLRRLAFFGRLDQKKGLLAFTAAVNALEPALLHRLELVFLGKTTATWTRDRVASLLSESTTAALRSVAFETDRDQHEALELLGRPGTLAVMPSLWDNSPNTVYECLERRIPFIASNVGGIGELVAARERQRVLFEPTPAGIETALRASLAAPVLTAVEPAFAPDAPYRRWNDIVHLSPEPTDVAYDVETRFAIVCAGDDVLDEGLARTLELAARTTGADVVTCATRRDGALNFFSGRPRGLQVLRNDYGTVALVRLAAHEQNETARPWPLLTTLELAGARIVSVPLPLVTTAARPGSLEGDPAETLLVVEQLERALPRQLRGLARLAAGLAADGSRRSAATAEDGGSVLQAAWRRLRRARGAAPG